MVSFFTFETFGFLCHKKLCFNKVAAALTVD